MKEEIAYLSSFGPLLLILLAPLVGSISDTIGRKRTINTSLLLMIFSYVVFITMGKNYLLLGVSILLAVIANEAIVSTLFARVEDNAKDKSRGRVTGLYETFRTVGFLGGAAASAYLVTAFPVSVLFKIALILLIAVFLLGLLKKSHNHNKIEGNNLNPFENIRAFLKDKNLRGMAIIGFGANFMVAPRNIFVAVLLLEELHASQSAIGLFTLSMGISHLTQYFWGKYCDTRGSSRVMLFSVAVWSLLFMCFYFAWSPLVVILLGLITGLAAGAWNVAALSYLSRIGEKTKQEGSVMGSYGSLAYLGVFAGMLASGYISQTLGTRFVFVFLGAVCLIFTFISSPYLKDSN